MPCTNMYGSYISDVTMIEVELPLLDPAIHCKVPVGTNVNKCAGYAFTICGSVQGVHSRPTGYERHTSLCVVVHNIPGNMAGGSLA